MATEYTKTFTVDAHLEWVATAPTLEMTFSDLILEVAEAAGIAYYGASADEEAQIPTDAHDLALCKRVVNKGFRDFIANGPPNGWRWMRKIARITFAPDGDGEYNLHADPSKYILPLFFQGNVNGKITYDANTNSGAQIEWVDEATIRRRKSVTSYTGIPRWASYKPSSVGRQWELEVYPVPSAADTIVFPWTVSFDKFVNLTDVSPAGAKFDNAILSAVLARAEMDLENMKVTGNIDKYYKIDLPAAKILDGQTAPRRIGNLNHQYGPHTRVWNNVTYSDYDGNPMEV